jgi:hypothetical protein
LRGLWIGGFAVVLALVAVAPVLAIVLGGPPTSSSSYTSFAPGSAQGSAGNWKNTSQTVAVTAIPDHLTVDATETVHFSSDNGSTTISKTADATGTATFTFPVSLEGSHAIQYWASDVGGTEGRHTPGYINIDETAPTFTSVGVLEATSTQSTAAGWTNVATQTISLVATDTVPSPGVATSGVKQLAWSVNGGSATTTQTASASFTLSKSGGTLVEGKNTVTYSATDWAGNLFSGVGYVNIDTVAPSTEATPALAASATTGWRNTPLLVTLSATDVSSGVPSGGTTYSIGAGAPQTYTGPFVVGSASSNASYAVKYFSTDRAGNVEATSTGYVNIDTTIPTVTVSTSPSHSSGWYNKNVTVTLKGADSLSGVAKTQYRLQGASSWTDAVNNQFTVPASANAVETFDYQAVDNAGNVSAPAALTLKMDNTGPATQGAYASGKAGKSITLRYRVNDKLSPRAQGIWLKIKDSRGRTVKNLTVGATKTTGAWHSVTWKTRARGTYTYYVYAKDLAGNQQRSAGSAKIKVK